MRATTVLTATLLALGVWAAPPAIAQQQGGDTGVTKEGGQPLGSSGAATAVQGGAQGDCPEGQVMSAGGHCEPGQPGATAGTGSTQMPASPHQQETLKQPGQ
jgi:hypothetical protein